MTQLITRGYSNGLLASNDVVHTGRFLQEILFEGLVVDIILDHKHKKYSDDGFNVGNIKVRIFSQHYGVSDDKLPWARPIDAGIQEFPLIGEYVYLERIGSAFWYRKKLPISRRLNQNAMINVNQTIDDSIFGTSTSKAITSGEELSFDKFKFGTYFKPDSRIRQLKAFEGDTLFQGRMGASIRFGSSKMSNVDTGLAPNIVMRVGQGKDLEKEEASADSPYGLVVEDVNKDTTSLWMTTDQNVGFEPSTIEAGSFYRSIFNPEQMFDKAQFIANSGRVVLNAKNTHIMLFANQEIYLNAFSRVGIDTDGSVLLSANNDVDVKSGRNFNTTVDSDVTIQAGDNVSLLTVNKLSIVGNQIFIGSTGNFAEPAVGGTSLSMFLGRLILTLMGPGVVPPQIKYQYTGAPAPVPALPGIATPGIANFAHVVTPLGPGLLNPTILANLQKLYLELYGMTPPNIGQLPPIPFGGAPFNALGTFISLNNEDMTTIFPKNEFKLGEQVEQEQMNWKLSQDFYKVTE